MKQIILFLFVLFLFSDRVDASNGSIYSSYGIGELQSFMSARSAGMGGTGVALLSDGYINRQNPAAIAYIANTRLEADFQYRGYAMSDETSSSFLSGGNFQGAFLAFPISQPEKIVLALGATPYSTVAYAVNSPSSLDNSILYNRKYDGSGGLTDFQIAVSYAPTKEIVTGISTHYIFGTLKKSLTATFSSVDYFGDKTIRSLSCDGVGLTLGSVITGIDKLTGLSRNDYLDFGFTFFSGTTLQAADEVMNRYVNIGDSITSTNSGTITIPFAFAAGLVYRLHERTIVAADFQFSDWKSMKYFGSHPQVIRAATRIGAGIEFIGKRGLTESYFEQIDYRLGGAVQFSYLQINSKGIDEYSATAGFSLPISSAQGETRIHLAFEAGTRGAATSSMVKETFFRFTTSVSSSELFWFIPPEVD